MAVIATIQVDEGSVQRAVSALAGIRHGARRAITRSLNRVAVRARSRITKAVAAETGVKQKTIREDIALDRATFSRLAAKLTLAGERMPLIEFRAKGRYPSRGKGGGVTYSIGQRHVQRGFIAVMKSEHKGVFARQKLGLADLSSAPTLAAHSKATGKLWGKVTSGRVRQYARVTKEGYAQRLPIRELKGVSLPRYFGRATAIAGQIIRETMGDLDREIHGQVDLMLKQAQQGRPAAGGGSDAEPAD